ncbi:MAG: hypothetical protein J6V32_00830 [Elusimicrobiaceae bacterium]|nr:hypothetical protein [Elusimicrobiaceae bacterium]
MGKGLFKIFLVLILIVAVGMSIGCSWELGDVMKALFADKPRIASPAQSNQEYQRGRAQELRPDISVPPPAQPTDPTPQTQPVQPPEQKDFTQMISGLEQIAHIASEQPGIEAIPTQAIRPADAAHKVRWAPPPPGFFTADTFNYLIYREKNPVTSSIKSVLDTIHGNLMLDLTPFTVIIKPNKLLVMLFASKDSYHDFTHLPSWSGASSDLQSDTMYVIEGSSFYALSVHELTHLYFDGYFLPTISPLWLSEGMAVYMQIYASKQKPSWVDHSLRRILSGEIIPFDEMTTTEDLNSYDTSRAELWYTQAYSVVDYLLNNRTRDEFYKFCNELKNKTPLYQALYRAYGMPFNKVSVLQNVWLHDLQKDYQDGRLFQTPPTQVKQAPPADGMTPQSPAKPAAWATPKKPAAQKTKINKLETVDPKKYWEGTAL